MPFEYRFIKKKAADKQFKNIYKQLTEQEQLYDEGFLRKQTLEDLIKEFLEQHSTELESYGGPGLGEDDGSRK